MKIIISNHSYTPIFEQIKNALINQIISGELEENEMLDRKSTRLNSSHS